MGTKSDAGIYVREAPYLERYVQIGLASGRVLSVSFPESPPSKHKTDHRLLDRVEAYLEGAKEEFDDVKIGTTRPTDQWTILETLRTVPYGEGVTVETLARMTSELDHEDEADHRLVRRALANNPTPIFIPDHRVSDGPSAAPPAVEQRLRSLEGL